MSDFVKRFMAQFQENVVQGSQHYIIHYKHLRQQAEERLYKAKNEYKRSAKNWGYLNRSLGISAIVFSVSSAVFTLSTNQVVTVTLSLLSATSAGFLTFLNPSAMEIKFRTCISDCLNFYNEVISASLVIDDKSASAEDKLKKLEDLNRRLKFLDENLSKII
jgi:hypothetical protein